MVVNKADCASYSNENKHQKSHARKIIKHLKRFPDDDIAKIAWGKLPIAVKNNYPLPTLQSG